MRGTAANALLPPHRRDDGRGHFLDLFDAYIDLMQKLAKLRQEHPSYPGKEERVLFALDRVWEALEPGQKLEAEKTLRVMFGDRWAP